MTNTVKRIMDTLKVAVGTSNLIDVGRGAEGVLGVTWPELKDAVEELKKEGYKTYVMWVNITPKVRTNFTVLCKNDIEFSDVLHRYMEIRKVEAIA